MGRRNRRFRKSLVVDVEVDAPDAAEADRRIEDVADALRSRFVGTEVFRRFDGGPRRIAGRPHFRSFDLEGGRPVEVDPLDVG